MKLLSAFQYILLACPLDDLSLFHISSLWDMALPLCSSLALPVLSSFKLSWSLSLSVSSTKLICRIHHQKLTPHFPPYNSRYDLSYNFPSSRVNLKFLVIGGQHGIQSRCVYPSSIYVFSFLCTFAHLVFGSSTTIASSPKPAITLQSSSIEEISKIWTLSQSIDYTYWCPHSYATSLSKGLESHCHTKCAPCEPAQMGSEVQSPIHLSSIRIILAVESMKVETYHSTWDFKS